jgi:hypothetical protein
MKLSKLIEELNLILENDGDLDVCIWSDKIECHFNLTNVITEKKIPVYPAGQCGDKIVSLD